MGMEQGPKPPPKCPACNGKGQGWTHLSRVQRLRTEAIARAASIGISEAVFNISGCNISALNDCLARRLKHLRSDSS
jgi:hypothetical protein